MEPMANYILDCGLTNFEATEDYREGRYGSKQDPQADEGSPHTQLLSPGEMTATEYIPQKGYGSRKRTNRRGPWRIGPLLGVVACLLIVSIATSVCSTSGNPKGLSGWSYRSQYLRLLLNVVESG